MKLLLQSSPDIDNIVLLSIPQDVSPWGLVQFIHKLRQLKFDIALELTHYYRLVSLITFFSGISHRVGFAISGQGRNTMLTKKVRYSDDLHEIESFGTIAAAINAPIIDKHLIAPTFATVKEDTQYIEQLLNNNSTDNLIVIHPGTSATAKSRRWPAERFQQLADELSNKGYNIIFSGSEEEKLIVNKILSLSTKNHLNLVDRTTLGQLLQLFRKAKLVVSLDTGPMHLAAASSTPTLGLFGANTPKKWGPYGLQHKSIYHGPETPCTQQQYGKVCNHPEGYHMQDITVEEVLETTLNMLQTI